MTKAFLLAGDFKVWARQVGHMALYDDQATYMHGLIAFLQAQATATPR